MNFLPVLVIRFLLLGELHVFALKSNHELISFFSPLSQDTWLDLLFLLITYFWQPIHLLLPANKYSFAFCENFWLSSVKVSLTLYTMKFFSISPAKWSLINFQIALNLVLRSISDGVSPVVEWGVLSKYKSVYFVVQVPVRLVLFIMQ